ncbi:MAG: thiamine-phosphate kinase [Methanomicrobiales archaeon]
MDDRALLRRVMAVVGRETCLDDCAVVPLPDGYLVLSTDMVHRETDFPAGMTDRQTGWMAVAVTLSDIAAMGAVPGPVLLAVGLDREDRLDEVMAGAHECCSRYGATLAGGDIDFHRELTLVATGVGWAGGDRLVRRSGAAPGDRICLTGTPGQAQAALAGYTQHLPALFEPEPRVREGILLGEAGVSAMMDTSDGLVLSLFDLQEANPGVGFSVRSAALPLPRGAPPAQAGEYALFGAGDYELLFTAPADREIPVAAAVIGEVTAAPGVLVDGAPPPRRGFLHTWE